MPSVRRYLELGIDHRRLIKHLIYLLTSMDVAVKSSVDGFISAVHGSYSALHPKNVKKRIEIIVRGGDGRSSVEVSIDYTSYVVYGVLSIIMCFITGSILFYQAVSSIDYLDEFESNPFIVLVREEPWLLHLLSNHFKDIESIRGMLMIIEFVSIGLLISGVIGIVYMIVTPLFMNSFADELVSRITASAAIQSMDENHARQHPSGKKAGAKGSAESKIYNVSCMKRSNNVILCSIEGENLSLDHIEKALVFLGFSTTRFSSGVVVGENSGSFFADRFPSKKMRVRAIINPGGNNAEIIFETSVWIGFSKKDCSEAETLLKRFYLT